MKLTTLHLERFGARSNLRLDQLSDQLNVIYGPNGSGKSTLIHFIRWVLFGGQEPSGERYVAGDRLPAAGSLTILDGQQQRRIVSRSDDGSPRGQVRIDSLAGSPLPGYDPGKLTGIEFSEYCHVFSFGFDQAPAVDELVRLTAARGFELFRDEPQLRRMQEVNDRLAALRQSGQRLSEVGLSSAALQDRRRQVQVEIDAAQRRRSDRLRDLQQECQRLYQQQREQQQERAELDLVARRMDQSIELRRSQLEEVASETARLRQQWLQQRHHEVAEIDYQIEHWHQVLDLLRRRQDELQSRVAAWASTATATEASDEAELRTLLRALGYQVDDLEQDLQELPWADRAVGERVRADYLRSVLGTALHSMRTDVQRLYNELQQQRAATSYHDHARELAHLRRCELELSDLMDVLSRRRQTLVQQETAGPYYVETVGPGRAGEASSPAPYYVDSALEPGAPGTAPARLTDPVLQARLQHLLQRRDYVFDRIRETDRALELTQQRLDVLQSSCEQLDEDRHLQHLRQDLAGIEEQLRRWDDSQRAGAETASLEAELERLRDALQPSPIVQEASAMLEAMTDRALRRLRVSERQEVCVEDQRGDWVRYGELSRGMRDQVYLSLSLALVAAYRQRGTELPLVLNDVFVNIDSDRAQATANVLAQFAARGHQILLFTRHEHVLQLFSQSRARLYTLRERNRLSDELPVRSVVASEPFNPNPPPPPSEMYYVDQAAAAAAPPHWMPRPAPSAEAAFRRPLRRESQYDWVARWDPPRRPAPARMAREETGVVEPLGITPREDTSLADVISLSPQAVSALRDIGVLTVGQLLEANPDEAERRMARSDITAPIVYRWQSELALQCHAGLSPGDAALLVACGVDDPEELASIDVTELHRRIELLLADADMRGRYGSISRFERSRLARWIDSARRSHYRRYRSRGNGAGTTMTLGSTQTVTRGPVVERHAPAPRRVEAPRSAAVQPPAPTLPEVPKPARSESQSLKFLLERSDPLLKAPSIGPKTSERFEAIGMHTVADLLESDPVQVAERINYRRITAELVGQWQAQARLVCHVPNLRGQDAQLLLACGVTTPELLAGAERDELFGRLQQLLTTAEGKRLLRNGAAPGRDHVAAWIGWARQAR